MESVGQKLREARLRIGLTLEQVSADTRITLRNLTAIEADDLSRISSPFFYRSFVKLFASKVKIDYDTIASAVQQAAGTMPPPLMPGELTAAQQEGHQIHVAPLKIRRHQGFKWLRSVVSFCLVIAACSGMYAIWQTPHDELRSLLAEVNNRVSSVTAKVVWVPTATAGKSAEPLPTDDRLTSAKRALETPLPNSERALATDFHVRLSAIERTWLSIVEDGKQVFTGVLDASESKFLEGRQFARIRTGNAGGLSFTFNGKELGVLGARGEVRTVVFTKDKYQVLPSAPQVALTAFTQSAKGADARDESVKESADSSRGALDAATVLRGLLKSGE
jgi:cytoskeleton protein RodZ